MWNLENVDSNQRANNFLLEDGNVHLWSIPLNINTKTQIYYWRILSLEERKRADSFKFVKDKIHFIAGRGSLRTILGKYLKVAANEVELFHIKNGKPTHRSNIEFNLSNSGDWAVLGLTLDSILGVDIEYIKRKIEFESLADRYFSQNESNKVIHSGANIGKSFYNCWTRKEAFIKAIGDGLSFPLKEFEVSCLPDEPTQLLKTNFNPKEVNKWSLRSFQIGEDYVGAFAIKKISINISYYKWQHIV